jgi:hypothetical protein
MSIQIRSDGIYVDNELKIPANKETLINGVYDKLEAEGFKTINGESLLGSGNIELKSKLLQVKFIQTSNERYYFNTVDEVELPGLNTIITPKSNNSYFLVFATINSTIGYVHSLSLKFRDKFVGNATSNNSNHPHALYHIYRGSNSTSYIEPKHIMFAIENNSLDDAYIGIWFRNKWGSKAYPFYYNDRKNNDTRSLSTMIIMEVEK